MRSAEQVLSDYPDLQTAKACLEKERAAGVTAAAFDGTVLLRGTKRGVASLVAWIQDGTDLTGFCAADPVIGKAAALLYVKLHVKALWAGVISEPASAVLDANGIVYAYGEKTAAIRNRDGSGFCPMETAAAAVDLRDPDGGYAVVLETLEMLKKQK